MKRRWLPLLTAACLAAGCSSLSDLTGTSVMAASSCGHPQSLMLVVGAHQGAPAPSMDQRLVCRVDTAIRASLPVRIVVPSGQPALITPRLASVHGGTLAQQGSPRVQQDVQRVLAAIAAARPHSPGVDDLAALAVAADEARSSGDPHAELVLIDSGLDDRGALDFTVPGMVAASPAEVVHQLQASGNLPDLRGFTVVLVGLGYTAPPQAPMPAKWRSNITRTWADVMRAAGASVEIIPQPGQGPSVQTSEPVREIPVPPTRVVRPKGSSTIVFTQESPVRFEPNTTVFADPTAAVRALRPIARWLVGSPDRRAVLEGTTADVGLISGQVVLSKARAARVRDELVSLGASPRQISIRGVGSRFPQFTPDRNASGVLLAGPAAVNRSVRITLS